MSVQIVLADPKTMYREGLASLLDLQADLEVVGQTDTAQGAVALARELSPDVVILYSAPPGAAESEGNATLIL